MRIQAVQTLCTVCAVTIMSQVGYGCYKHDLIHPNEEAELRASFNNRIKASRAADATKEAVSISGKASIIEASFEDKSSLTIGFSKVVDQPLKITLPKDADKGGLVYLDSVGQAYVSDSGEIHVTRVTADSIFGTFNAVCRNPSVSEPLRITEGVFNIEWDQ